MARKTKKRHVLAMLYILYPLFLDSPPYLLCEKKNFMNLTLKYSLLLIFSRRPSHVRSRKLPDADVFSCYFLFENIK